MPAHKLVLSVCLLFGAKAHAQQSQPRQLGPPDAPATRVLDQLATARPDDLFRFDPMVDKLVAVAADEVKPGYLYNRHHPQLGRVWSVAVEGGGYQYAMAPGSTQPAWMLDLRASAQELRQELMARAPELAKMMDVRGAIAYVRLGEDQSWTLVRMATIANVFDLETGRRWEWHGPRRVAVMHTSGYEWQFVDGKPIPDPPYYIMGPAMVGGVPWGSSESYSGPDCW